MVIYFTDGTSLNAGTVVDLVQDPSDNALLLGKNGNPSTVLIFPLANFKYATLPGF